MYRCYFNLFEPETFWAIVMLFRMMPAWIGLGLEATRMNVFATQMQLSFKCPRVHSSFHNIYAVDCQVTKNWLSCGPGRKKHGRDIHVSMRHHCQGAPWLKTVHISIAKACHQSNICWLRLWSLGQRLWISGCFPERQLYMFQDKTMHVLWCPL